MAEITIPPEAVEAALAEILGQNEHLPRAVVSAAIRAAIAAWPGMAAIKEADGTTVAAVYLPLPQEARDE